MESVLQTFKDVICKAQQIGEFPVESKLVLRGRIDYAVERGDLTQNEARNLDALLGDEIDTQYRKAVEIATFGDVEAE